MYQAVGWTVIPVIVALLSNSAWGEDARFAPISMDASLQFRGAEPLNGTLLNVGKIDALIDGTPLSIPIVVVRRVEFAAGEQPIGYVTLSNDSRIKCEVLNQEFRIATEWGEVNVHRTHLATLELTAYTPAPEVTTWDQPSADSGSP